MAGTQAKCRCGNVNDVPRLTALKRSAGQDTFVTNAAEMVLKKISNGELPTEICVECSSPTKDTVVCIVELERRWVRNRGPSVWSLLPMLLFAPLWMWIFVQSRDAGELHGRDSVLKVPITLCPRCRVSVGNLRRSSVLKNLMAHVETYRQLLKEYPDAAVGLERVG